MTEKNKPQQKEIIGGEQTITSVFSLYKSVTALQYITQTENPEAEKQGPDSQITLNEEQYGNVYGNTNLALHYMTKATRAIATNAIEGEHVSINYTHEDILRLRQCITPEQRKNCRIKMLEERPELMGLPSLGLALSGMRKIRTELEESRQDQKEYKIKTKTLKSLRKHLLKGLQEIEFLKGEDTIVLMIDKFERGVMRRYRDLIRNEDSEL
jgi:hypothetical protein